MKNNKKGFTLAELLIVVAIIAVLVAISIPIFSAQLEKSREATDLANLRAKYAELAVDVLDKASDASDTVALSQKESGWKVSEHTVGGVLLDNTIAKSGGTVTITVSAGDGTASFSVN